MKSKKANLIALIIIFIILFSITISIVIFDFNIGVIYLFPINALLIFFIYEDITEIINSKKSQICYGFLADIIDNEKNVGSGIKIHRSRFEAIIYIYILKKNKTKFVKKELPNNYDNINKNDYVRVKYYNGRIYSIEVISIDDIPSDVRTILLSEYSKIPNDYLEKYGSAITNFSDDIDEMIEESEKYNRKN